MFVLQSATYRRRYRRGPGGGLDLYFSCGLRDTETLRTSKLQVHFSIRLPRRVISSSSSHSRPPIIHHESGLQSSWREPLRLIDNSRRGLTSLKAKMAKIGNPIHLVLPTTMARIPRGLGAGPAAVDGSPTMVTYHSSGSSWPGPRIKDQD